MSETKEGGGVLRDEFLSETNQTAKKTYPLQTMQENISTNKQQQDSKNSIVTAEDSLPAILTQVIHEKPDSDVNLPLIVNESLDGGSVGSLLQNTNSDRSESNTEIPRLEQTTESLDGNKIKLDLVEVAERNERREKIGREDLTKGEIDKICGKDGSGKTYTKTRTPGLDPRFQQQNQTLRCFVMYTDFYRCEKILGEGEVACQWFKDVFTTICPLDWVRRWDEARETGVLPWMKSKTQGKFPGDRYGV